METLINRRFLRSRDLDRVTALLRTCRGTGFAEAWPTCSAVCALLTRQPDDSVYAQVWEDAAGTLGAFALIWDEYILVSAMHPHFYHERLEATLLHWAWATVRAQAGKRGEGERLFVPVCSDDYRRIALLEREGLVPDAWRTLHMVRSLVLPVAAPVCPEGFVIRPVNEPQETVMLIGLCNQIFIGMQKTALERASAQQAKNYHPSLDLVAVAPNGTLAGLCLCSINDDRYGSTALAGGWIDRIGVHRAARQDGLGRVLLGQALHAMQHAGLGFALLTTGTTNLAARQLFTAYQFQPCGETLWYILGHGF